MMTRRAVRIAAPIGMTAMMLAVAACDTIGNPLEALGAKIPPPDEFQVIAHKPLVMPTTTTLPVPRPGAASPLDPDPNRDALQALLGTSGSPVVSTVAPSAGEQVLLSSANSAAASADIRVQLEEEKNQKKNVNKPYEAPSIGAFLGFDGGEKLDESELLDPVAESQRLQNQGHVTPVDPDATAEVEEDGPAPVTTNYPTGRPQNAIIFEGTAPAN